MTKQEKQTVAKIALKNKNTKIGQKIAEIIVKSNDLNSELLDQKEVINNEVLKVLKMFTKLYYDFGTYSNNIIDNYHKKLHDNLDMWLVDKTHVDYGSNVIQVLGGIYFWMSDALYKVGNKWDDYDGAKTISLKGYKKKLKTVEDRTKKELNFAINNIQYVKGKVSPKGMKLINEFVKIVSKRYNDFVKEMGKLEPDYVKYEQIKRKLQREKKKRNND